MNLFTPQDLQHYLAKDPIGALQRELEKPDDNAFASHRWLKDTPAKRLIFHSLYGDLLSPQSTPLRILDVGGGFTSLTRALVQHHDYHLLDIMAHDSSDKLRQIEQEMGKSFWIAEDWYHFQPSSPYDLVIANDLFPNVDQRLALFLEKMTPFCRAVRLSLTFYNTPRFYLTKRLDGDEVLTYLAWDGKQLQQTLSPYVAASLPSLETIHDSIFPNKRQVIGVEIHAQATCS